MFPGKINFPPSVIGIELYLKVSDPKRHADMLCGPTHQRQMTEKQFIMARRLHDFTVAEAKRKNKAIVEFSEGFDALLEMLNEHFRKEISIKYPSLCPQI